MLISDIRQTSPGRLTVRLEDGTEIKTTLGVVTDLRLYSGRELDESAVEELKTASVRALARERAWLCDHALIDDESCAAVVARHYAAKGYGAGRVRAELSRRGIERELWDGAIGAMPENEDKIDKFIASRLHDPEDRDEVRKLSNALYRRGYSWDEIRRALERHRAEAEIYED